MEIFYFQQNDSFKENGAESELVEIRIYIKSKKYLILWLNKKAIPLSIPYLPPP